LRILGCAEVREGADGSADEALRALERFETSTRQKPSKKFHIEQARWFRADLAARDRKHSNRK
jgi:hypothetical protein